MNGVHSLKFEPCPLQYAYNCFDYQQIDSLSLPEEYPTLGFILSTIYRLLGLIRMGEAGFEPAASGYQ